MEVAVAGAVLAIALVGVFGTFLTGYQMTSKARARDQVRALLQSYCDQFLRAQVTGPLFQPNGSPTGSGMTWTSPETGQNYTATPDGVFQIPLGDTTTQVTVTASVSNVDPTTGNLSSMVSETTAGNMLAATFTATYTLNGQNQSVSLTVLRTNDPASS